MQPYIGQIILLAFPRVPTGWAICDGSLMQIDANPTLYNLIGTTYGGDGVRTFGLPDLRGRVPLHQGQGQGLTYRVIGEISGHETVTLLNANLPSHNHQLQAASANPAVGATAVPGPTVEFGKATTANPYAVSVAGATAEVMDNSTIGLTGGSLPHNNMMPTLIMNYCIATEGIYPSPG